MGAKGYFRFLPLASLSSSRLDRNPSLIANEANHVFIDFSSTLLRIRWWVDPEAEAALEGLTTALHLIASARRQYLHQPPAELAE